MLFILNVTLFLLVLGSCFLVMTVRSKQLPTRVDAEAGNWEELTYILILAFPNNC